MKERLIKIFETCSESYGKFKRFIPHYVIGTICITFALSFSLVFSNWISAEFINKEPRQADNHNEKINGKLPSEYKIGKPFNVAIQDKKKPLVVEFFADWCPHCRRMTPVFKKTSKAIKNANFTTVDTQKPENEEISRKYNIDKFPTIIIINTKTGDFEELELNQNSFEHKSLTEQLKNALEKY